MSEYNFKKRYKELEKKYLKLKKEYNILDKRYTKIKKRAKIIKQKLKREYPSFVSSFFLLVVGIVGLLYYRESVILELALIGLFADILWEHYGTSKGWWKYKKSKVFMIAKVPIEIPFLVFTLGLSGATVILFLLGFF